MSDREKITKVVLTLAALCVLVALAGVNRKFPPKLFEAVVFDPVRITDLMPMLVFAPLILLGLWLLFRIYDGTKSLAATWLFLLGFYLLGTGFGMHVPMNTIHIFYRDELSLELMEKIAFFDDQLAHWLFFGGFMFVTLGGIWAELNSPFQSELKKPIMLPVYGLAILVGLTIYYNMIKEDTIVDIIVLISTVTIGFLLHYLKGFVSIKRLPATAILYIGYGGGTLATMVFWLVKGY